MAKSLIPIDVIASNVCSDIGDSTMKHKFKITRHILSRYQEIHQFISDDFDVKTQVLEYGNVISLPSDFVFETKVGLLYKGCIAILSLGDPFDRFVHSDEDTRKYLDSIWSRSYDGIGYYFYNAYRGNGFLGELYGMGRGVYNSGTYRIDRKNGCLYVGSHIPREAEIIIEYKSDGVSDGIKLVPSEMQKCLEFGAKADWYADRNITQSQINEKKYRERYYQLNQLYNFKSALYMAAEINEMFSPTNY